MATPPVIMYLLYGDISCYNVLAIWVQVTNTDSLDYVYVCAGNL